MSIRFCDSCGNMLTPKLKDNNKLVYICGSCNIESKEKENNEINNLVYRNEIRNEQTSINIDPYITNDPTYARSFNLTCPKCGYKESICFQNPNINDPGMKLIYYCCNKNLNETGEPCKNFWFKIGITFYIVPRDWDQQDNSKILEKIDIYGFDFDVISDTIKQFYKKLDKKYLPIFKMLYDRNELEEDNQNIWKIIFKKDCNVLVFTKNDYQYFKINNLIKN